VRILVIAPRLEIGGAEMHLARLLPSLRRSGLDVSLFTISRGGPIEGTLVENGVPVCGVEQRLGKGLTVLQAAVALRREISRRRPEIVHYFLPEPYLIGSLAVAGRDGIIRIMSRRSLSDYQQNHRMLARVERFLHHSVDALIGNSQAVAAQLVEESGTPWKVGVIHNGVDPPPPIDGEIRAARRRELDIPSDAFVMVITANLIPYKGHADLLDALGAIRDRLTVPWRLVLIGRDHGLWADLNSQAESSGIANNLLWLGERADAAALIAIADLGVLPSHQEGFSNSLIEKMAQGLPVVATRVGGNTDAVLDGVAGRLVPPRDPASLGEAILELSANAGLRSRMGTAARLRVESQFSLQACSSRYLNLYTGLMDRKGSPVAELIDPPAPSHRSTRSGRVHATSTGAVD
jgi:glycosyltransferase involved in cell wall biosynthesis